MRLYNYNKQYEHFDPLTGLHTEVCVDTVEKYGFFEEFYMQKDRDIYCHEGGLWFELVCETNLELVDQDGTYFLPKTVAYLLRRNGFVVDKDFE